MVDLGRWDMSIQYAKTLLQLLRGESYKLLEGYPDTSDTDVVQFIFDTLDRERLYNDVLYDETQEILDRWLVDDISALEARMQITEVFADTYDFGC